MSAKNFTLDEALARIEALEKRKYGWTEEVIFEGDAQNTGFALTKPFNEYDYIIVQGASDGRVEDMWQMIPTKYIVLNHRICLYYSGAGYWNGYFDSYTHFNSSRGDSDEVTSIQRVIGVKINTNNL